MRPLLAASNVTIPPKQKPIVAIRDTSACGTCFFIASTPAISLSIIIRLSLYSGSRIRFASTGSHTALSLAKMSTAMATKPFAAKDFNLQVIKSSCCPHPACTTRTRGRFSIGEKRRPSDATLDQTALPYRELLPPSVNEGFEYTNWRSKNSPRIFLTKFMSLSLLSASRKRAAHSSFAAVFACDDPSAMTDPALRVKGIREVVYDLNLLSFRRELMESVCLRIGWS
mmetsp:Transcript_11318/g.16916  ORF Transcript_11318/g.16916 Transcript_11318/m.16916 type:complete len:227 (+) Transcript_11318:457-1137(+)